MDNSYVIYVQSSDLDNFGFIKNFDYRNTNIDTIKYTKKYTNAMQFPDEFFTTETYNVLTRYLDKDYCLYRILKW